MLGKSVTFRLNAYHQKRIAEIAAEFRVDASAIYRKAVYRLIRQYEDRNNIELPLELDELRKYGGAQPEDSLFGVEFKADPDPAAKPARTMPAPPEFLADLSDKQEQTLMDLDSKARAARIKKMQEKSAGKPEGAE